MIQVFEINRDDYLRVTSNQSTLSVDFMHRDQHNVPIKMDGMVVTLERIVNACHHQNLPKRRKFVYQVRYCYVDKFSIESSFTDENAIDSVEIERVICSHNKVYSTYEDAVNKAIKLNEQAARHRTWFEKLLIKLGNKTPLRYRWIASPIEVEE